MFVNIHKFIEELNKIDLGYISNDVQLCFDVTGFYLKGKTTEETNELNKRYSVFLSNLNKIAGIEELLTVSQIANHLKMSPNTIYQLLKNNLPDTPNLPYIDTPKGIRIKNSDYFNFLLKCYHDNENND